jgi:hypothetical protein
MLEYAESLNQLPNRRKCRVAAHGQCTEVQSGSPPCRPATPAVASAAAQAHTTATIDRTEHDSTPENNNGCGDSGKEGEVETGLPAVDASAKGSADQLQATRSPIPRFLQRIFSCVCKVGRLHGYLQKEQLLVVMPCRSGCVL